MCLKALQNNSSHYLPWSQYSDYTIKYWTYYDRLQYAINSEFKDSVRVWNSPILIITYLWLTLIFLNYQSPLRYGV